MRVAVDADEDSEPPGRQGGASLSLPAPAPASPEPPELAAREGGPQLVGPDGDFPVSPRSLEFRQRCYPRTSPADWNDWRWQLRHRLRTVRDLSRVLAPSADEAAAIAAHAGALPLGITPYYASLLDPQDPLQALRRSVVPASAEHVHGLGEAADPLGEQGHSPVPGIVHRYPDRVLFLTTGICATYCRYCTRSRLVGARGERPIARANLARALHYIASKPNIRDVLLSGGDPLTMPESTLATILEGLSRIPHVEIVRIGTKVPAVLPQRITPQLLALLRRYVPIWMSLHFTHPDELTPETAEACGRLADTGIPLGSQTVLLRGVNDDVDTMKRLFRGLLRLRVRPYYLYQCDPILGSEHFRTPVAAGIEIIRGLRGHTSGYAVPHFVVDAPGGGGKIPLMPHYRIGYEGTDLLLRNYEGGVYRYPDTAGAGGSVAPSANDEAAGLAGEVWPCE